jgi:hypothetical protein
MGGTVRKRSEPNLGVVRPLMRRDLPMVTARVLYHRASISIRHISWLLERDGAGFQCTLIRRIDVVNVEVEKSGHRSARTDTAHHDNRITNSHLRRCICCEVSARFKRQFEEHDQLGWIMNDQPRSNAMPAFWNRLRQLYVSSPNGHSGSAAHRRSLRLRAPRDNRQGVRVVAPTPLPSQRDTGMPRRSHG